MMSSALDPRYESVNNNYNPWPYVNEYFEFISDYTWKGGAKNLKFKCKLCLPKVRVLSVNKKSTFNLKSHLSSKHPERLDEFEWCAKEGGSQNKGRKPVKRKSREEGAAAVAYAYGEGGPAPKQQHFIAETPFDAGSSQDRNEYGMENEEQSSPYESTAAPEELNPMQLIPNEMIKMETPTEDAPFCSYPSAERDAEDEDYYISKAWSAKLKRLAPDQKMYAEKAINDIMFEAGLGTLHKYSVQINEILPVNISHLSSVLKHGTVTEANMDNTF